MPLAPAVMAADVLQHNSTDGRTSHSNRETLGVSDFPGRHLAGIAVQHLFGGGAGHRRLAFEPGSPEEIRKATAWDPDNAELCAARAHSLQLSFDGTDVNQVIGLYETATRLSPNRAQYWAELGGSYEWAGRAEEARRTYARAQELFPNSPEINWKLGNFYIRAGKTHEALSAFHKTLLGDPQMRAPVFDLAWRAGIDQLDILREMIPADTASLLAYLDFLVARERLDEASQTWARLLRSGARIGPQAVFPYLDALIRHDRGEELEAAWVAVLERSHSGLHHRAC